ncbi:MAG: ATP-binding protein [Candidatus Omnitrophota bacterium]
MKAHSIKFKILSSQLILTVFTMLSIGGVCFFLIIHHMNDLQQERMQRFADVETEMIENTLRQQKILMERITISREFEDYAVTFKDMALIRHLSKFEAIFPVLAYVDQEGQEAVCVFRGRELDQGLGSYAKDAVFQESLRRQNMVVISPVTFNERLGEPVFQLFFSQYRYFGNEYMGTLVATLPVAAQKRVGFRKRGVVGDVVVIDLQGRIIYHSQKERLLTGLSGSGTEKILADLRLSREGFTRASVFGVDSFVIYMPMHEVSWALLVVMPVKDFFAVGNQFAIWALLLFVLTLLTAVVVSLRMTQRIVDPILGFISVVRAMARGDLSQRACISSYDEIRHLAEAFNSLAENLEKTIGVRDELTKENHAQRLLEQQHRAMQQYLNQIIESLPDATMVIDKDKKVVAWNRAMETLTGVSKNEMLGKGDYEYALPFYGERRPMLVDLLYFSVDEVRRKYDFVRREKDSLMAEVYVPKTYGGKGAYLLGSASLLYDQQGCVVGAVETIRDVSDRHLAMEQLNKARIVAEEANQAKSRFLSTVSHEIRTPLHAIISYAESIAEVFSVDEARHHAKIVLNQSGFLLSLINDLLDQAKIEAGKIVLVTAPMDFFVQIKSVQELMRSIVNRKGLDINLNYAVSVPHYVVADEHRLKQVLINLVGNAVKFTAQGSVTMNVLGVSGFQGRAMIRVEIVDTGIGIPAEKLKYVFDPFFQVDGRLARKFSGTGLGTTISKNLVELMGGEVGCVSEIGKGSTFWFTFPIIKCTDKEVLTLQALQHPVSVVSQGVSNAAGLKVLVVDDYEVNLDIIQIKLAVLGIKRVVLVLSGEKALEACRTEMFDCIFMDVQMNGMDGIAATRAIRALGGRWISLPIFGVTAHADQSVGDECLKAGMNDVLVKPFRGQDLLKMLCKWL